MAKVTRTDVLRKVADRIANSRPLLEQWGEILLDDTFQHFIDERASDGTPWEPLAPSTRKRVNPQNDILFDSGALFESIDTVIEGESVAAGPADNLPYEFIQQLGGRTGPQSPNEIPARPYMGISDQAILSIRESYLNYWFNNL